MAKKEKRATDELNIAISGIDSAIRIAMRFADKDTKAALEQAQEYCAKARDAMLTIQLHAALI